MESELLEKLKSMLDHPSSSHLMDIAEKKHVTLYDVWEILKSMLPFEEAYKTINELAREFIAKESQEDTIILERMFVQKLNESNLKNRETILNFLDWLINFCKELSTLKVTSKPRICDDASFMNLLRVDKLSYDNMNILNQIESAYLEVVSLSTKVCEDIKQERFINAYLHYTKILKVAFKLIALLSIESVQQLSEQAKTDPLTGLLNRRYMHLILRDITELSSITEQPFTIAIVDIDDFKRINDSYGHLVGDCILKKLAKLLRDSFRRGDYIFRYGGEEFLIVMPSTSLNEAVKILERFRKMVERHIFRCEGKEIRITVSIGVYSDIPKSGKSILSYIRCADIKLYKAKRLGKNRVVF